MQVKALFIRKKHSSPNMQESGDPRAEFPGVMSDGQRAESTTEQETGLQRDTTNSRENKRKHEENRNRQRHGEAPATI